MKTKKTDDVLNAESPKSEYRPPELVEYGTLAELTGAAGTQPPQDNPFPPTVSGQGGG